jgi:hypothetical protein
MSQAIKKSDTQIHHDVLEELKWDSRVDETEVGLQVAGGVVTLTGTVTSWAKRVAAQEAARRVIGVLDVANDIKAPYLSARFPVHSQRGGRVADVGVGAREIHELDRVLRDDEMSPERRREVAGALLDAAELTTRKLQLDGRRSNHPMLDAHLDQFRLDIIRARDAARADPPCIFLPAPCRAPVSTVTAEAVEPPRTAGITRAGRAS